MSIENLIREYPYFHGDNLVEAIKKADEERKPLARSFIAENSLNLWYAKDGAGKSVLAVQSCLEGSAALPMLSTFETVR